MLIRHGRPAALPASAVASFWFQPAFVRSAERLWKARLAPIHRGQMISTRLGRVCKGGSQPEQDHADVEHCEIVDAALLVAGGDAPGLLEAVDQALDPVAQAIGGALRRVSVSRDRKPRQPKLPPRLSPP